MKVTVNQLRKLIGNPEAFAEQHEDGTWHPITRPLTDEYLAQHLDQEYTYGTYVLWNDKARTLVFDIDDEEDKGGNGVALDKAESIRDELVRLGVPQRSIGIEFSGKKGYHVWLVAADYLPAKELRRLGRTVLALLNFKTEVFPKQDEAKKLGNLVKLPCGLHQVSKKENNFVDRIPQPCSLQVLRRVLDKLPPEPDKPKIYDGVGDNEVVPCMAAIANGVEHGGRNTSLYHYAVLLRGTKRLTDEAVDLLVRAAAAKCRPPYGATQEEAAELESLLESSKAGGPLCEQLPAEIRCGDDQCVRFSKKGKPLQSRAGQLKSAREGEGVVLEVDKHEGGIVILKHPDLRAGGKVAVHDG